MSVSQKHIDVARSLPPRLLRFFARYPPSAIRDGPQAALTPALDGSERPAVQPGYEDPFAVVKHPVTGRYRPPVVSLRRQADLAKLAKAHGVESLLPFTIKSLDEKQKRREQDGLQVKGTGVGQKVKGHWWERTLFARQEARRQAMREMPALILKWKNSGHGRNPRKWTKWPK